MKKNTIMTFVFILMTNALYAQGVRQHIIQRGETIASVAKKYGTTEDDIRSANPEIGDMFYVGMKINVPEVKNDNRTENVVAQEQLRVIAQPVYQEKVMSVNTPEGKKGKVFFDFHAGLSFNSFVGKDAKKSDDDKGEADVSMSTGFHVGISAMYFITDGLFVDLGLNYATKGYKGKITASSGAYWDDEGPNYDYENSWTMKTNNIDIPINIGYSLPVYDDMFMNIKAGPYLTYAFSGSNEGESYTVIYEDIHSSSSERITYSKDLKDLKDYKKFGYGISCGIGLSYKNFNVMFTYQRGLSKLYKKKKKKTYEQNMLITLGYTI